ncbi:MAG: hypothetical protein GXY19_15950 [Phycisphaerae bacterium]|nr:hypothetical protein [Phycisphaerae bacterium]
MARTKGAKDKRPRKKPALSMTPNAIRKRAARAQAEASTKAETPAPKPTDRKPDVDRVAEFNAAIDAELSQRVGTLSSAPADRPADTSDRVGPSIEQPAGPVGDEALLTRQAWEGVCRVPFRTLGLCLRALGVIEDQGQAAIGNLAKKRAPDLARPSYVIFEHYAKQYTAMNPDDPISLAIVATGLVAADIAEELTEIIVVSRAIARRERGGATDGSSETRRPADGPQTGRQT